MASIFFTKDA
jgi:hypothetical protein